MPFMIGKSPIRRTMKYLNAGKLALKNGIQVFSINYNTHGEHHQGAKDFIFWYVPQVQYRNPEVQVISIKNLTPSPFITCYYANGKKMLIDIESRTKEEIMEHLIKVVGKTQDVLEKEAAAAEKKINPANFGNGCPRHCICEVPGQLPCPSVVPLPFHMRGKYKYNPDLFAEVMEKMK
ncbi:GSCOCG00003431001-RA-CDS [Cotesia congregata]|uniref:Small ribosomal subunit protein mS25 n=1 Tax=Cotesia congregata TaxID=51543 RepID=A0A8J2HR27_COTCN|nr:GSCOCG00003431001-RA-CDS [Cotesia congregata]CAG5108604.1 Similar to mRpS25: Probable 28S ribosomal protein S25 [Cotesia congregata]